MGGIDILKEAMLLFDPRGKWVRGMVSYSFGAIAATAVLGGVLGYLGDMLPPSLTPDANGLLILGALAALHALHEPQVVPVPMPQTLRDRAD